MITVIQYPWGNSAHVYHKDWTRARHFVQGYLTTSLKWQAVMKCHEWELPAAFRSVNVVPLLSARDFWQIPSVSKFTRRHLLSRTSMNLWVLFFFAFRRVTFNWPIFPCSDLKHHFCQRCSAKYGPYWYYTTHDCQFPREQRSSFRHKKRQLEDVALIYAFLYGCSAMPWPYPTLSMTCCRHLLFSSNWCIIYDTYI